MKLLIIGGSNSLVSDGYVKYLHESLRELTDVSVKQISVGGTTSLSAIGRLNETADGSSVDFILYEYSINDAGHFSWRENGADSYLLCLQLLIQTAARLYPSAVLVPLLFASEHNFSATAANPFHDMQLAAFSSLSLPFIDVRQYLSCTFLGKKPAWLYKDAAHYSAPHATSLIGAFIAKRLLDLEGEGAQPLSMTLASLALIGGNRKYEIFYIPAVNLVSHITGKVAITHIANRLMILSFLRMHPGSKLYIKSEMFPLALYLKSDPQHGFARLTTSSESGLNGTLSFPTRHADTSVLPFIYTSIPVPLLFGQSLRQEFGPSHFELAVEKRGAGAASVSMFDCFVDDRRDGPENYLDLIGILFAVEVRY